MYDNRDIRRITFSIIVKEDVNECNDKNGKNCNNNKTADAWLYIKAFKAGISGFGSYKGEVQVLLQYVAECKCTFQFWIAVTISHAFKATFLICSPVTKSTQ
jgi:hypothetical protein